MQSFDEKYWKENYSEPEEMDGLANATEHLQYLYCLFELENIEVKKIADFGFGLGKMLEEACRIFVPTKVFALEPSKFAFDQVRSAEWTKTWQDELTWSQKDLVSWCLAQQKKKFNKPKFDLGICFSVMQYIPDEELVIVSEVLAKACRYLYASMPTKTELKRQRAEFDFNDRYAIRRSRKKYLEILGKDWTIVGSRLLESKHHETFESSPFSDYLFRF